MRAYLIASLIVVPFALYATTETEQHAISDRIKPIGEVNIAAETTATATPKATATASTGQATYEQYCIVCHRDGLAGAPKFRDQAAWAPRLKGRDMTDLIASVRKGKNAMPPNGTCQTCSDSDIKAVIEYMTH